MRKISPKYKMYREKINTKEPLIKIGEVAAMAGVKPFTIWLWVKKGLLTPAYQIKRPTDGRMQRFFRASEVEAWVEALKKKKEEEKNLRHIKRLMKKKGFENLAKVEVPKCE